MSDQATRELERRWRATRSAADEAAWLGARVRAGELAHERLDLLARVGSQGARRLLGADAPKPERDVQRWLDSIIMDAPELGLRTAIAALRHLVPVWERQPERCERHGALGCQAKPCTADPRVRRVLLPAEATALSGRADPELLPAARAALEAEQDLGRGPQVASVRTRGQRYGEEDEPVSYGEASWKVHAPRAAFRTAIAALAVHGSAAERVEVRTLLRSLPNAGLEYAGEPGAPGWDAAWSAAARLLSRLAAVEGLPTLRAAAREQAAARRVDQAYAVQEALEELRAAVSKELLPWVLGADDPLRASAAAVARSFNAK